VLVKMLMKKAIIAWKTAINELKRPAIMLLRALTNSETADDNVGAMMICFVSANFLAIAVLGGAYYFYTNSQNQRSGGTRKLVGGKN